MSAADTVRIVQQHAFLWSTACTVLAALVPSPCPLKWQPPKARLSVAA
ncbi:hypothetical protein [Streptomyces sp. WM6386]|nr:hypothetical protein [Streptomyces sp. WM6386]